MPVPSLIKVAHRGASGSYPENTRLAFEKALEASVDMIEMDCQLSRDGHVVIFHDQNLRRIAGVRGTVKGKTLHQLKKLDVGARFKRSFRGERIMTLEEVMSLLAGKVDLNLEIKAPVRGPLGIELKILFILSYYRYLQRSIISSSDRRVLERVREFAPNARIGIIYSKGFKDDPFEIASRLDADSVHIEKSYVTVERLRRAQELGLKVFVWTVNDVGDMNRFLSMGVHGIISDFPERFWKIKLQRIHR
jgi:glycerophosphoryl diester phosphodiesterase